MTSFCSRERILCQKFKDSLQTQILIMLDSSWKQLDRACFYFRLQVTLELQYIHFLHYKWCWKTNFMIEWQFVSFVKQSKPIISKKLKDSQLYNNLLRKLMVKNTNLIHCIWLTGKRVRKSKIARKTFKNKHFFVHHSSQRPSKNAKF